MAIHLPQQQNVVYNLENINLDRNFETTLTGWFQLNSRNINNCRSLRYTDIPSKFVWSNQSKKWTIRKKKKTTDTVSRMYAVPPTAGEKFYLRLLLQHVKGNIIMYFINYYRLSKF